MANFEISEFNISHLDSWIHDAYAALYCQIWKEPPWLEDFWTPRGVKGDIANHLRLPGVAALLVFAQNGKPQPELAGFTLGYTVSQEDMRLIASSRQLDFIFTDDRRVFYVDELGVDSRFRGKNLGKLLSRILIARAKTLGHQQAILRTDMRAVPARSLYANLGFRELDVRDGAETDRSYWLLAL
ncbi:MAG: GNAT family N-acetyltransferase [Patescibacteria group bacterium]